MTQPFVGIGVTVVVPTLNRGRYLIDTITDLLAQRHRPLEILLVDQSDATDPEIKTLAANQGDVVSHYHVAFRGLPIARNFGWQMARHEIIVFVDDDVRCGPELITEHLRMLQQSNVGLSAGGIDEISKPDGSSERTGAYDRWLARAHRGFSASGEQDVDHVPGGNFGASRGVLSAVRGLDEQLGAGAALFEETDLSLRAIEQGYRIRFNGAARLTHLAANTGGTRQPDYPSYVRALSHNRSIVIRRHSEWFQWPVALANSVKLILAYTLHNRDPHIIGQGLRGLAQGWATGRKPPQCTNFIQDDSS